MTSTLDVIKRAQPSVFLRSKMETASVAIPRLSGPIHFLKSMLLIMMQCFLTFLANDTFKTKEQVKRYFAKVTLDLILELRETETYVHLMNHLTVIETADQMQINLVMVSQKKVTRTCSLTRRMENSQ